MSINAEQMKGMLHSATEADVKLKGFEDAVAQHGGEIATVLVTEEWCGDTLGVLPLLAKISDRVERFHVTVFRASEAPALNDRLTEEGMDRFPKVVFFDSRGNEIGRFMERSAATDTEYRAAVAEFGDPESLMQSEEEEAKQRGMEIFTEIGARMQKAHDERLWRETSKEWLKLLRTTEKLP
jgi:hypothetical protein